MFGSLIFFSWKLFFILPHVWNWIKMSCVIVYGYNGSCRLQQLEFSSLVCSRVSRSKCFRNTTSSSNQCTPAGGALDFWAVFHTWKKKNLERLFSTHEFCFSSWNFAHDKNKKQQKNPSPLDFFFLKYLSWRFFFNSHFPSQMFFQLVPQKIN